MIFDWNPITRREYLGLDWDSHGHWNKPFFFAQIADPLLGVSEAMESSGGAVWEVSRMVISSIYNSVFSGVRCCGGKRVGEGGGG